MLKKMAIIAFLGATAVVLTPLTSPAHASPQLFENLTGKWRGKGMVKGSEKGKKESIRCRMTNEPSATPGRLDLSGNCAVSGFVFSLNGYIQQNGSKNSYTASMFKSLANLKQDNFSGRRNGNRINFKFSAYDRVSKSDIIATIRLNSKSSTAFVVQVSRTDPDSGKVFDVGTIEFAKR